MVYGVLCIVFCVLYAVFSSSWLNFWLKLFKLLLNTVMVYYWRLDKENSWQRQIIISKIIQSFNPWLPSFPPFSRVRCTDARKGSQLQHVPQLTISLCNTQSPFIKEIQPLSIILKRSIVNFKHLNSIFNFNVAALLQFWR